MPGAKLWLINCIRELSMWLPSMRTIPSASAGSRSSATRLVEIISALAMTSEEGAARHAAASKALRVSGPSPPIRASTSSESVGGNDNSRSEVAPCTARPNSRA
jgi:hypothetical protein